MKEPTEDHILEDKAAVTYIKRTLGSAVSWRFVGSMGAGGEETRFSHLVIVREKGKLYVGQNTGVRCRVLWNAIKST